MYFNRQNYNEVPQKKCIKLNLKKNVFSQNFSRQNYNDIPKKNLFNLLKNV